MRPLSLLVNFDYETESVGSYTSTISIGLYFQVKVGLSFLVKVELVFPSEVRPLIPNVLNKI